MPRQLLVGGDTVLSTIAKWSYTWFKLLRGRTVCINPRMAIVTPNITQTSAEKVFRGVLFQLTSTGCADSAVNHEQCCLLNTGLNLADSFCLGLVLAHQVATDTMDVSNPSRKDILTRLHGPAVTTAVSILTGTGACPSTSAGTWGSAAPGCSTSPWHQRSVASFCLRAPNRPVVSTRPFTQV